MHTLHTDILTERTAADELIPEWNDLLARSTASVFQTPEFLLSWWETLGSGELCVLVVRDETEKLVGLAPLMQTENERAEKQLSFIGCVAVSDYLDCIVDTEYSEAVYAHICTELAAQNWNTLYLCSVAEHSPLRAALRERFPAALETQQDVCPIIALPNTWEEYLTSLERKQRHELRRKMRNNDAQGAVFTCLTTKEEVTEALPDFITLHELSSAEKKSFWTPEHRAFFARAIPKLAGAGKVHLYFLSLEGTHVAAMLIFVHRNGYYLYNSGFNPAFQQLSSGTALTGHTIQQALAQQLRVYDFLRGSEEYKFRFGAVASPVFDYTVVR